MHKCVKQNIIVHFIIQKLKNKHTFLKKACKLRKLNPLILTEREDSKTRYFPPLKPPDTVADVSILKYSFRYDFVEVITLTMNPCSGRKASVLYFYI